MTTSGDSEVTHVAQVSRQVIFRELEMTIKWVPTYEVVKSFRVDSCYAYKCGEHLRFSQDCFSQIKLINETPANMFVKRFYNEDNIGNHWPSAFQKYITAFGWISFKDRDTCIVNITSKMMDTYYTKRMTIIMQIQNQTNT